jgi:glycosyltransferase involved in cell wall biosynthesis
MEGGGSERQMVNLIRGLDPTVVSPELFLLDKKGALLDDLPSTIPIHAYWPDQSRSRLYFPGRILSSQIKTLGDLIKRDRFHVVYERLFHMALIAGAAARRAGVPRVATIVSPPEQDLLRTEHRFVWLKRWILARSYRAASRLLAVSHGTADNASRFYNIPRSRFEVLASPIDLDRIDKLRKEVVCGPPLRQDRHKIISIGRLSEEKGHRCLIKALGLVTRQTNLNIELHLVGDGELLPNLQNQAVEEGIAERVVFHGQVANPFPLLSQADLFCLPSLYEGLPNALLEAMAVGIPAMASNCEGGIREVTANGTLCTLVNRDDPVAWLKAIQDRFDSPSQAVERAAQARIYVEQSHALPKWICRMEQILIEAANDKSRIA